MKKYLNLLVTLLIAVILIISCKKDQGEGSTGSDAKLSYGESIFYLRSSDYTVRPSFNKTGTYSSFPDNLLINSSTGEITITVTGKGQESQTGMKYKVMFEEAATGKRDSTYITIAGINYLDKIYYLSQNDSIIRPIYNHSLTSAIPAGTYGIQADNKLAINPQTGEINIKECIRRGLFKSPAENGEWEELAINYKSNDNSSNVQNNIDVAIYFYNRLTDVPSNVSSVMRAHQTMMAGLAQPLIPVTTGPIETDLPDNLSFARPRPPCIVIVAN